MKRLTIILLVVMLSEARAQQVPIYSQYVLHEYLINPAIAGTYDYYDAKLTNRLQWTGINEAPPR